MGSPLPARSWMRRPLESHLWFRAAVAVVVLTANVSAPFSSSGLVRTLLTGPGRHADTSPVHRVRVTTQCGATHGFRAVAAFSGSGPGVVGDGSKSCTIAGFLPSPVDTPPSP